MNDIEIMKHGCSTCAFADDCERRFMVDNCNEWALDTILDDYEDE